MQSFGKALRVLVGNMTGGMGLPELARQIVELLRMRGVDRAGERVDEHSMALSSGPCVVRQSESDSENDVSGLTQILSCRRLSLVRLAATLLSNLKGPPAANWGPFAFSN